jgi:4-amino-4-deoxy-L-arabinose transferase-like glycosyltransferase
LSRSTQWLLAILGIGIALRLAWIYCVDTQPVTDFKHYNDLALSLVHSRTYTIPEGLDYVTHSTPFIQRGVHYPSAFRPPGYPFFLAFLYRFAPSIVTAKIANVLLGAVWILCAYLLGRKYWHERAGLWAAFLTAVFPPAIAYSSVLATEPLAVALLMIMLCLYAYRVGGRWNPLLIGVLMGMLSLVKPFFVLLPLLYALLLWRQGASLPGSARVGAAVLVACLAMALVISPWTIRNYLVFHHFVQISTNGDFVLYINNNDLSTGSYDMDAMRVPGSIFKTERILDPQGKYNEAEAMDLARREAMRWILHHPRQFMSLGWNRVATSYVDAGGDVGKWSLRSDARIRFDRAWVPTVLKLCEAAAFVVVASGWLYTVLILFLLIARRSLNDLHKINLFLVLLITAVIFFSEGQPRFVFVAYPFFILGIAWTIERLRGGLTTEAPGA